jgi:predicted PurR-regulated permease PerM
VKQVAKIVFWAVLTLAALALLWAFRGAVVLLLLSIAVAAAVRPLVDVLHRHGLSFRIAIAVTYGACLGIVGVLGYVLAARLLVELPFAADQLIESYGHHFEEAIHEIRAAAVAERALGGTMVAFDLLGRAVLVIVLSIYWTGGGDAFERMWLSFLPVERRRNARAVWDATRRAVGAVLRRELGLSVVTGLALSAGFWAAQSELWALGTLSVLILRLIPLLGKPVAVAAAGLSAAPSGLVTAIVVVALTITVLTINRTVLAERAFPMEKPLDPLLEVLVILALAGAFGIPGLIAAPLVAAAIQSAYGEIAGISDSQSELPKVENLAIRMNRIEARFRWSPPPPEVASILSRLNDLIERSVVDLGHGRRRPDRTTGTLPPPIR